MTKYLTTTTVTVHGVDTPVEFADTATYNGGSAVAAMVKQGKDIYVKDSEGVETIIPWHAVMMATIEHSTSTAEDPVDAFCTPEDAGETDGGNEVIGN